MTIGGEMSRKLYSACLECGEGVRIYPSSKCKAKFCSKECRTAYKWKHLVDTCEICQGKYHATTPRQKYCSNRCRYIKGKESYEKRKKVTHYQIFERDGFKCQYCGKAPQDDVKLVVDHIYPVNKGGSNDANNLITSCYDCNASKSNKILSMELLSRFWDVANKTELDFSEARGLWENETKHRRKK